MFLSHVAVFPWQDASHQLPLLVLVGHHQESLITSSKPRRSASELGPQAFSTFAFVFDSHWNLSSFFRACNSHSGSFLGENQCSRRDWFWWVFQTSAEDCVAVFSGSLWSDLWKFCMIYGYVIIVYYSVWLSLSFHVFQMITAEGHLSSAPSAGIWDDNLATGIRLGSLETQHFLDRIGSNRMVDVALLAPQGAKSFTYFIIFEFLA